MGRAAVNAPGAARRVACCGADDDAAAELRALLCGDRGRGAMGQGRSRLRHAGSAGPLGRMLLEGSGVRRRRGRRFRMCSEQPRSPAMPMRINMVGRCLRERLGHARRTSRWRPASYAQAAEAGLAWAQYNLGHLLLDGNGVPRDRNAAFDWYMRAAAQGHERAMNLVARCYEEGWGVDARSSRRRATGIAGPPRAATSAAPTITRRCWPPTATCPMRCPGSAVRWALRRPRRARTSSLPSPAIRLRRYGR